MPLTDRQRSIRSLVQTFLNERLSAKLEKLPEDDPKRDTLSAQFEPSVWLEDAARRASKLQAATHSLKQIHPDAKGTNLYLEPNTLATQDVVGSHVLGNDFEMDVVGNAAYLDVYTFLKLEQDGRTLLALALEQDADLARALSDDVDQAWRWIASFAGLVQPREGFSSHTHAKQLYWLVGDDPHDDANYHLLAPLYPTSLVHRVYQTLQNDRFGDEAKAAREARKAGKWHECPVREYPHLAVQKLGGTKPQNISQLNSERGGTNYLLASLPPVWQSPPVQPLFNRRSMFDRFGGRREVRVLTRRLAQFLEQDPKGNQRTRQRRDDLVDALIEELIQFTAELRTLEPFWSKEAACKLAPTQRAWLDPDPDQAMTEETIEAIAEDFAIWINRRLRQPLPLGHSEYLYWRKMAWEQLRDFVWESGDA